MNSSIDESKDQIQTDPFTGGWFGT